MNIKEIIELAFLLVVMARGLKFTILLFKGTNPNHIILFPSIIRPIYGEPPYNTDNNTFLGTFLLFFDLVFYMLFDPVAHTIYLLYKLLLKVTKKQR